MTPEVRIVLLVALGLFVVFLVFKSLVSLGPRGAETKAARKQLAEAKARAVAATDPKAKAIALREAAVVALDQLGRPVLAAGLAARALRTDPDDAEVVTVLARALTRARRLRALERLLWNRLAGATGPAHEAAYAALIAAYEGPMRRPQWAAALRGLRGAA